MSDSNAASKAAALKLLENVRELPFVPTDHAVAKWNSTEPLTINKMDNLQKFYKRGKATTASKNPGAVNILQFV